MPIQDLASHHARYVTVAELAEYWAVSRRQIYKRIESGTLDAIRLGFRLYRVRTEAALAFERRATVSSTNRSQNVWYNTKTSKLPEKIGLRRVRGAPAGSVGARADVKG